ncbi:hypothetical protein [Haloglomus litoreum]|uniref:hypothetical protein n=1 Tax=Haloglomus litoreum TaxID=3034026 RepID=UPI0023E7839E|nr:hypothetical protein [Haloglomus sp. DT116]
MGRTNPTYRDRLRGLEERWQPYRRGLRRREQGHYDQLWADARQHADAAGYLNHDEPLFPVFLSMLLAQQARIATLEEQLTALEAVHGEDGSED